MIRRLFVITFIAAIALAAWWFPAWRDSSSIKSFVLNREGLRGFKNKNFYQAYQKFTKALEDDPLNPELQLNLARTFEENEEIEKAEQAYRAALQLFPPGTPRRFEALFNWAVVLAKLKRIDDALAAYQLALELDPNSIEVKTNIELLFQGGGGGGGQGDQKDKPQDKDGDQKGKPKDQDPKAEPNKGQDKKNKPKPFESQDLSKEDVKRILDEIKNQEQNIRAQEYEKGAREMPKAKDW